MAREPLAPRQFGTVTISAPTQRGITASVYYRDPAGGRIHINSHRYDEPLVPREDTRGVIERVGMFGKVVIPLREEFARQAARELIANGGEGIAISLLHSYKNPEHERRVRDIVEEEIEKAGKKIPVFASADYYPVRRESHRTKSTVLEAYAAEPSRQTLRKISDAFRKHGAKFDTREMATHGGTISWKARELARTVVSGSIGGVIGAKYLGETLGYDNIVCSDIGGTSFDVALITRSEFSIQNDPDMARLVLSLPLVGMDSVGAGAGSMVRLDPYTKAIKLGPDSASYRVVCVGAEEAAAGVIEILDTEQRDYVKSLVSGKGYSPESFVCFSYGGAGPVHTYGYTEGLGFQDVLVPASALQLRCCCHHAMHKRQQ